MQRVNRILTSAVVIAATIITSAFSVQSSSGRAGYTGSPGESTCNTCHNSFALNSGAGFVSMHSSLTNGNEYVPGQTYTITIVPHFTGRSKWGFDFEALSATNQDAGTFTLTNTIQTKTLLATIGGNVRRNIVHTGAMNNTADSCEFTFNWVAPSTNIGAVNMFYTTVCANASNTSSGDYVYSGSLVVQPATTAGITGLIRKPLKCYWNHELHEIIIDTGYLTGNETDFRLFNLAGRLMMHKEIMLNQAEANETAFEVPASINEGIYLLTMQNGPGISVARVLIN